MNKKTKTKPAKAKPLRRVCRACEGTGKSSKSGRCVPCNGTGWNPPYGPVKP